MKALFNKYIISLILGLSTLVAFSACKSKEEKKVESETFKVGMECAYAPFNWTQNDDSNDGAIIESGKFANGYDVQIAKKIAESLGKELVIVKTEWDGLTPALTSGKIDAIIAGMSATEDRKKSIDFSNNYYKSDLVIVVKKDSPYANAKTKKDFSGAKITAQLDTFHYTVIDQLEGALKQNPLDDFPTMVIALSSGKIDGYISEKPGALSAASTNSNLTFVEFDENEKFEAVEDEISIAVGLKKGSTLIEGINQAISKISEDERKVLMDNAIKNQPSVE